MIENTSFVVVDLETTGLEPKLDRIIEIAAVRVRNGEIVGTWDSLVNPGIFIPQESTAITGITTEMVKDAPPLEAIMDDFLAFLGEGTVFVAHNVDFDREFVNQALLRMGRPVLTHPYACTFKLAKQVHPNISSYALGALCQWFKVDLPQAHRALDDARATAELLTKFLRVLQNGGLRDLKDIPSMQNLPKKVEEVADGQASLF